ncbi:MAG: 30S ribosome-binding factor RbfA [bacterium]|nr:30S ribosome-binding factor RbfA [bacterium]MDT8395500.1 30S ribosome-binding factor RbfA [bacterium]
MSRYFDYKRADRVSELLKHEISEILFRETKDPGIGEVTITRVEVTDDLKLATVYFGVLDRTAEAEQVTEGLQRAGGHIQRLLGKRLRLRFIPKLTFQFDRNLDYSMKIAKILQVIDEEGS